MLSQNKFSDHQICSKTTSNIQAELALDASFNAPTMIIGGTQFGISCADNFIPIELCFITEQHAIISPTMRKHSLAKLNTTFSVSHF
jgi:hypothetical protein